MNIETKNEQKYVNYREQFKRLKKAISSKFFLEAIFIEYAIIEDRIESILKCEKNEIISNRFVSIEKKIAKVISISVLKDSALSKYISEEFMVEIKNWKEERNRLIHALLKNSLTTEE